MLVKKGNYTLISDPSKDDGVVGNGESSKKEDISKPNFRRTAPKDVKPPEADFGESGLSTFRDIQGDDDVSKKYGKAREYTGDAKTKIADSSKAKKNNWSEIATRAFSNTQGLSSRAKNLLGKVATVSPKVDWKKELRKFFDYTFKGFKMVQPSKRFISSGDVLYGRKMKGKDTLRTIVCAVDTSGSISDDQIRIFLGEIMYLCKTFSADQTIIIYCSDNVDGVDKIKKNGTPDLSKLKSTGGNNRGFVPPFEEIEKMGIKPSVFVYLTDTGGEMPDPRKYGISKYADKVIWFVCSTRIHYRPPFGKIFFTPPIDVDKEAPFKDQKIDRYGKGR
jgi:predicted metal-dependent peptidase